MTAAKKYPAERLMNVVLAPVVSEKSTRVADKYRQYVFRVADGATKPMVKAAVELMFKTSVESVTITNVNIVDARGADPVSLIRHSRVVMTRNAMAQLEEMFA